MNVEEVIEAEASRLAQSIADQYHANKISASDLGDRLFYIDQYKKVTLRALDRMQSLENGL